MSVLSTHGYQAAYRMIEPYGLVSMKKATICSLFFHAVVIALAVYGFPYVQKEPLIISTPISVEMVDIDELTKTTNYARPKPVKQKKEEAIPAPSKPAVPKMMEDAPPDITKPEAPDLKESKKEVKKEAPKAIPMPPKADIKKKPKKKKQSEKEEVNDPQPKENEKESSKDFQSLLRNLTPDDPVQAAENDSAKDLNQDVGSLISQMAAMGQRMTISEQDALRQQLSRCWNVMAGAKYAENLIVEVRVMVNPDRTVQNASILDQSRYNRDTHFRAAADAALRALRNPACTPLALPPDKYEQWKTTVIRFDPREML